ncbi:MAG: DmsC/YnfH family molybdoenzyme membrane anchor subunit [Lautropia sp.]
MSDYLVQGKLGFTAGYKLQRRWGLTEACVFTLECAGAPLLAMSLMLKTEPAAYLTGLMMVMLAIGLLLHHLGHPRRAWKAVLNVRHSWISRGTLALGAFVLLGAAWLAVGLGGGSLLDGRAAASIAWVFAAGALFIGLYPGLVLSASPAIAFWNSGLLPLLSLLQGVASATAMLVAFAGHDAAPHAPRLATVLLWLLAANALVLALYVAGMLGRGAAAAESARHLLRDHAALFVAGACGLGIVLPFALTASLAPERAGSIVLALGALARLLGDLALRQSFLKVGMFERVI